MSLLLSAALALAMQTAPAPADAPVKASPARASDFEQARAALAAELPNYRDTWFRNTRGNVIMFCGEFNTQTDLGAFTGWLHFAVMHYEDGPARLYIEGRNDRYLVLCDPAVTRAAPDPTDPDYSAEMIYR